MTAERCACGLGSSDIYMCIEGVVYGPCESPECGGYCEATDDCGCPCHKSALDRDTTEGRPS